MDIPRAGILLALLQGCALATDAEVLESEVLRVEVDQATGAVASAG